MPGSDARPGGAQSPRSLMTASGSWCQHGPRCDNPVAPPSGKCQPQRSYSMSRLPRSPCPNTAILPVLALFSLAPPLARASWLPNGNLIAATDFTINGARVSSDGSGGAFIAYGNSFGFLYVSHVAADGLTPDGWPTAGRSLYRYPWWGYTLFSLADEQGGAFVLDDAVECAASCGGDPRVLLAQHVTESGFLAGG